MRGGSRSISDTAPLLNTKKSGTPDLMEDRHAPYSAPISPLLRLPPTNPTMRRLPSPLLLLLVRCAPMMVPIWPTRTTLKNYKRLASRDSRASSKIRSLAALGAIAFAASCSDPAAPKPPAAPPVIGVVSGNNQPGVVGTKLADPLVIRITDESGNALGAVAVQWEIKTGNGSVVPGASTTDAQGLARAEWTLGTAAGLNEVSVRSGNLLPATFSARAAPDRAATLSPQTDDKQSGRVSTVAPMPMAVLAKDRFGNAAPGVLVSFAADAGSVEKTSVATDSLGVASTSYTLPPVPGTAVVTASVSEIPPVSFTVTVLRAPYDAISAGAQHTCAIAMDGTTYCWGGNSNGQLGDGSPPTGMSPSAHDRPSPVPVLGGHRFVVVAVGDAHTCAITEGGEAYCWGFNGHGQLGNGTTDQASSPVRVSSSLVFRTISAGRRQTCGITAAGDAYCWGEGPIGSGSAEQSLNPVKVFGGLQFASLETGGEHTCGVTDNGEAYCWGRNFAGQLGDGTTIDRLLPTRVASEQQFVTIAVGKSSAGNGHHPFTCATTASQEVYCWGFNDLGQLGNGTQTHSVLPVRVSGERVFDSVSAGFYSACGLSGGRAYCWGSNFAGRLGVGHTAPAVTTPTEVVDGHAFQSIPAGEGHRCGLTGAGAAYCWGYNRVGMLGDGTTTERTIPTRVVEP